jgi:hypothetical protein
VLKRTLFTRLDCHPPPRAWNSTRDSTTTVYMLASSRNFSNLALFMRAGPGLRAPSWCEGSFPRGKLQKAMGHPIVMTGSLMERARGRSCFQRKRSEKRGISCSIVLDFNVMLRSNRAGLARHNWQKEQWEIFFSSEVTRCRNSPL